MEESGIFYKYSNIIQNFQEKFLIVPISILAGKTVFFKNLLRTQEPQTRHILVEITLLWLYLKKHYSFLTILSWFSFVWLVLANIFQTTQSQPRLRQFISKKKKIISNAKRFLGIPCSGQLSLCSLSVQHWDAQLSIKWVPIYIFYHFSFHVPMSRQFAEFSKNCKTSTET